MQLLVDLTVLIKKTSGFNIISTLFFSLSWKSITKSVLVIWVNSYVNLTNLLLNFI